VKPTQALAEDKVAILCFVIRPIPNNGGRYKLVGDAYVEGIMNGEALKDDGVLELSQILHID
jgi:hypothetical protein